MFCKRRGRWGLISILSAVGGGSAQNAKCRSAGEFAKHGVTVAADALTPINAVEERYDRVRGLKTGRRLGCQACIQGDVVLDVPPESQVHKQVIRKSASERVMEMDPAVRVYLVDVPESDMHEPLGDFQRLAAALEDAFGIKGLQADLAMMSKLQPVLRKGKWQVTAAVWHGDAQAAPRLVALFPPACARSRSTGWQLIWARRPSRAIWFR